MTGDRSIPCAVCTSHGPIVGPNRPAISRVSAAASSATVAIPNAASLRAVLAPMPHSASGGRGPSSSHQVSLVIMNTPAGLPNPVAIFACSLFWPIPTEQSRLAASRTCRWIFARSATGSSVCAARNASSHPITSTTASSCLSVDITTAEAAS